MALPVMTIDGDVIAVHSHWTSDGSRIVTEATVRTADGGTVQVSQLGGTVDGIGMRTMPGPELLAPGMKVALAAHRAVDGARKEHVVLDTAKVLAYPPGFVRTGPTKAGKYLFWESGCVYVTSDQPGTTALPADQEFDIIDASIATWNTGTASCSFFNIVNDGREAREVGRDNVNLIKFRDTAWGRPASGDDPFRPYSGDAAGITTAVYIDDASSPRDGAILDADVELNGVTFAIAVNQQSLGPAGRPKSELQNTLTHELGHLLGLEHPCRVGDDPPRVDNLGNAVPFCDPPRDPPRIAEATMYNFQLDPAETKKQTLSDDDIAAICAVYPIADDPGECDAVGSSGGGCCNASGMGDRPDVGLLLAGTALMILMRRRKTSRNA